MIFNKLPGYSIFYHNFDKHRQLRMPVTTFNQYLCGGACDSLPGMYPVGGQVLLKFAGINCQL